MKIITICVSIFLLSFGMQALQAQEEKVPQKTEQLEQQKEQIITEEKAALKKSLEAISLQLENREISPGEADRLREEAAKKHALNIENRLAIAENEVAWQLRNGEEITEKREKSIDSDKEKEEECKIRSNRTTSQLVIAAGFNNALKDGQSLNDSDFKLGGSRFFELGIAWRTRVFEDSNWLRLRYGISFQFNGLKPTDNRYFVEDGNLTVLEVYPLDLEKSKFKMDNLVIPLHFEFGPSNKSETDKGTWFYTDKKFKIGLGGFVGINIGERQKLKYEENGDNVKRKLKGDYNTNDLIYGLSGYIGWGNTSLYAKYDLNPIFKDPNLELNNISLGLRFDLD
ncbi:MAG: hypothetical protein JJE07_08535 [Flavobacteriaceae bacterium]|nr:hypothetical protein [Flavobacteriaceae bacterium]